ncbi:MAG: hypothetical protein ABI873_05255 [Marmoricola sp.]
MKKPGLVAFGAFLVVLGAVWFGQGTGWIGGSPMTGTTTWSVIGPVTALLGLALVGFGLRGRSRDGAQR